MLIIIISLAHAAVVVASTTIMAKYHDDGKWENVPSTCCERAMQRDQRNCEHD